MKKHLLMIFAVIIFTNPIAVSGHNSSKITHLSSVIERINSFDQFNVNPVFRNIKVSGTRGKYIVKGQAHPRTGYFHYAVEDGHVIIISETKVLTKNNYPNWSNFTLQINIPNKQLPTNGTITLYFFEKKAGHVVNVFPVILDRFY